MKRIYFILCSLVLISASIACSATWYVDPVPPAHYPPSNPKGPYYRWDELRSPMGPHRCSTSMQCSGTRTCSEFGWCQDVTLPPRPVYPRPAPPPRPVYPAPQPRPVYPQPAPPRPVYPQPQRPGFSPPPQPVRPIQPAQPIPARPGSPPPFAQPAQPAQPIPARPGSPPSFNNNQKGPNYRWDESRNPMGPNRCSSSMECSGTRTCSSSGWCG